MRVYQVAVWLVTLAIVFGGPIWLALPYLAK